MRVGIQAIAETAMRDQAEVVFPEAGANAELVGRWLH
jgi:hypothetical protein